MKTINCLTCNQWYFDAGHRGYSELTPGDAAEFVCEGHFCYYGYNIPPLSKFLRKDRKCKDYKHFKEEK